MRRSIAFVEDDETIRRHVARRLSAGYTVECFASAEAAWEAFQRQHSDLYIVDRMLPGAWNGMDLCKCLRSKVPEIPILILSALSESHDRIEGLKAGADDYLTKPFEIEELCLRVEALFKRAIRSAEKPGVGAPSPLERSAVHRIHIEGKTVDFDRFEVLRDGRVHRLAPKDCQLLKLLVEKEGRVVTRDEILDSLWGSRLFSSGRSVDNIVVRLRRLLEADLAHPKYIQSVRGMGYKFARHEAIFD